MASSTTGILNHVQQATTINRDAAPGCTMNALDIELDLEEQQESYSSPDPLAYIRASVQDASKGVTEGTDAEYQQCNNLFID